MLTTRGIHFHLFTNYDTLHFLDKDYTLMIPDTLDTQYSSWTVAVYSIVAVYTILAVYSQTARGKHGLSTIVVTTTNYQS